MKKFLSFLLVLVLIAGLLSVGASAAAEVMLSRQKLRADGVTVACEKYNIDGSNYFKLRDVAWLVNGTGSQFSVGYDEIKRVVSIVTGEEYAPDGSEMDLSGGDKSASAVPSTQTVLIDGAERSDLSVYNIGGNNYFKLRDLGAALGFHVDYDQPSNTAVIVSKRAASPVEWLVEEWISANNESGGEYRTVTTYDEDGRELSSRTDCESYTDEVKFYYDELGRQVKRVTVTAWTDGDIYTSTAVTEYDIWGNLASEIYGGAGDWTAEYYYTYDEYGRQLTYTYRSNYGETVSRSTYDANGFLIRQESQYDDGTSGYTTYVRDAEGRSLKETSYGTNGQVTNTWEYVYENGFPVKEVYVSVESGFSTTYTYVRDSRGNVTHSEVIGESGTDITDNLYDKGGRLVRSETRSTSGNGSVSVYQYNEEGRQVRAETTYDDGSRWLSETTYDDQGRVVKSMEDDNGTVLISTYAYDEAARKMTVRAETTYPHPSSMSLNQESLTLAEGETWYLYPAYEPFNALYEHVVWTSSDPAVATVDEDGCVTAVALGSAEITAVSESGLTSSCRITVVKRSLTFTADPAVLSVKNGYIKSIRCKVTAVGYSKYWLNYVNYDSDIITVGWDDSWTEDGTATNLYITGKSVGKASVEIFITGEKDGSPIGEPIIITVTVTE